MRPWIAASATLLMGCSVLVDLDPLSAGAGAGGEAGGGTGATGGEGAAGGAGGTTGTGGAAGGAAGAGGTAGADCGNDVVEAPEECDDGNGIDSDVCSNQCLRNRLVFVTSAAYAGNMGGLAGADTKCQGLAAAAGLPGTFRAWLSDSTGSPSTRMTQGQGYYLLTTGVAVASSWADLTDGQIQHPIDRDEFGSLSEGTFVCQGGEVWSNTSAAGEAVGTNDCGDWTSAANGTSSAGNVTFTDEWWTDSGCGVIGCQSAMQIYCFEQ